MLTEVHTRALQLRNGCPWRLGAGVLFGVPMGHSIKRESGGIIPGKLLKTLYAIWSILAMYELYLLTYNIYISYAFYMFKMFS